MEKNDKNRISKIVVIGPESTGKTTLASQLAAHFDDIWLPEYAREYVEQLQGPYTYNDVVRIAEMQVKLDAEYSARAKKFLFFDTDLIITKIWFKWVYNQVPDWIDAYLGNNRPDLYLLCATDLLWVPDNARENGGEAREKLFAEYKNELECFGFPYKIISGTGVERTQNAIQYIEKYFGL
jgi:NadR type nicotinamide-nucleotide adenylyltransferase